MADIESLFNQANTAQQEAVSGMQASSKLPEMLRQAVAEKFKDSPIYQEREGATQNLLNTPTSYRAEMANLGQTGQAILSPSQQQALVSQARSAAITPLMTLNDILSLRNGSVSNIMGDTMNAYSTEMQTKSQLADLLQQQAQSAYERDLQERKLAMEGGSGGGDSLSSLLSSFYGMDGGQVSQLVAPQEAAPSGTFDWGSFGLGDQTEEVVSAPTNKNWLGNLLSNIISSVSLGGIPRSKPSTQL